MEVHRLQDGLHCFGLSEVCRSRTEGDQPRESCNSEWVRVREKQKSFGGIISEIVANSTDTSDFQESSFADEIDVFFHREILV